MDPTKSDLQSPKNSAADSPLAKTFLLGPQSIRFRPFITKPLIYAGYAASVCMGVAAYLSLGVTFVSSALAMFGATISSTAAAIPLLAILPLKVLAAKIKTDKWTDEFIDFIHSRYNPLLEHVQPKAVVFMGSFLRNFYPKMRTERLAFYHSKFFSPSEMAILNAHDRFGLMLNFNAEGECFTDKLKSSAGCSTVLKSLSHEVGHIVSGFSWINFSVCGRYGIDFSDRMSKKLLLLSTGAMALSAYRPEASVFREAAPELFLAFAALSVSKIGTHIFYFMGSREEEFFADKFAVQGHASIIHFSDKESILANKSEKHFCRSYPWSTHPEHEFRYQAMDSHLAQISEAERLRRQEHVNKCVEAAIAESGFKAALPYPAARTASLAAKPA